MKYKKQIATGALAFSLLISGSSVLAATPKDLGIKNIQQTQNHKQLKKFKKANIYKKGVTVGIISSITENSFVLEIKNLKAKTAYSIDVRTNKLTKYFKNGVKITAFQLAIGQKVVVTGILDKTTNILSAKQVKIAVKNITARK